MYARYGWSTFRWKVFRNWLKKCVCFNFTGSAILATAAVLPQFTVTWYDCAICICGYRDGMHGAWKLLSWLRDTHKTHIKQTACWRFCDWFGQPNIYSLMCEHLYWILPPLKLWFVDFACALSNFYSTIYIYRNTCIVIHRMFANILRLEKWLWQRHRHTQ